jgi:hypothetical protein
MDTDHQALRTLRALSIHRNEVRPPRKPPENPEEEDQTQTVTLHFARKIATTVLSMWVQRCELKYAPAAGEGNGSGPDRVDAILSQATPSSVQLTESMTIVLRN